MLINIKDFPILKRRIKGNPLVYLDNAATTQKPLQVINAITSFYKKYNSNIHRGLHSLAEEATEKYEDVREKTAKFINAKSSKEIIFTKNATEAINFVAQSLGKQIIKKDDEILISALEHHSNILPWRMLVQEKNAKLKTINILPNLNLDLKDFEQKLSKKTKILAITGMSNVSGTVPPLKKIIQIAKKNGTIILIDGAQSAGHLPTNVQELDCDFFAFSAHKMLGPTGVGILYGKKELLETMKPTLYGGDMVKSVQKDRIILNDIPHRFEAGTPNIAGVIGFGSALDYLTKIGMQNIQKHNQALLKYAKEKFSKHKKLTLLCPTNSAETSGILSFAIQGIHPHDIATIFNEFGIAIRAGFHCAEPLIKELKLNSTARISFYIYNTKKDVDIAEKALQKTLKIFE